MLRQSLRWRDLQPRLRLLPFLAVPRAHLVNVKIKWVKDRALDAAVTRERYLRPALRLVDLISSSPGGRAALPDLSRRRPLSLPSHLSVAAFLRRYPTLFHESSSSSLPGCRRPTGPFFSLSDVALGLREEELHAICDAEPDLVAHLRRLLMLTTARSLPLHTVDLLSWDMGLPPDYRDRLVANRPEFFELVQPPGDERAWLKLVAWDPQLAVSELQRSSGSSETESLAFPVSFTRGFGLKKKCMEWLKEWQALPYTSPYADASGLDRRTDESEKRIVGVFHEILHLTLGKKTERRNVSNMRMALGLPQKFSKVFERHPGIFYLSEKMATQTVVLREAYGGRRELLEKKHPLQEIRERYASLMRDKEEEQEALPKRRRTRLDVTEVVEQRITDSDDSDFDESCRPWCSSSDSDFDESIRESLSRKKHPTSWDPSSCSRRHCSSSDDKMNRQDLSEVNM